MKESAAGDVLQKVGSSKAAEPLQLLNSQLGTLESVAHCVQKNWPVLLAGSQGIGEWH